MKKQSKVFQGLHAAFDELELLVIEGENLDLEVVEALQKRLDKLKKTIKQKHKK